MACITECQQGLRFVRADGLNLLQNTLRNEDTAQVRAGVAVA